MADRHRIGTFTTGGRFTTLLDVNDGDAIRVREFRVTPSQPENVMAVSGRRYGGARRAGQSHGNGLLEVSWRLRDATADETLARFDELVDLLESSRTDLFYEWRPDGASRSTYYRVVGGAPWTPDYDYVLFRQELLLVEAGFEVLPVAYGDPMDILDDFSEDTITAGDWTFDAGSGTIAVSGGRLSPTSTGAVKRLYHSGRGYRYTDAQVTVKVTDGPAINGAFIDVTMRRLDSNNALIARVTGSAGAQRVSVYTRVSGTETEVAALTSGTAIGGTFWVRGRVEGNVVTAEFWTTEPTPLGTPTASTTFTLTGATATLLGAGIAGYAGLQVGSTVWTSAGLDDFRVEPYTFVRSGSQTIAAHEFTLRDVPGTAPALVDAWTTSPDGDADTFVMGWASRDGVDNYCWNGHFESNVDGWGVAVVTNIHAAATSISRVTTVAKYGSASAQIVCPATSDSGASFRMYRRFKKGQTYTVSMWVRAASATTNVVAQMGNSAANDVGAAGTAVALSTTWQQITATWTPSADRDDAHAAVTIAPATATTFQVDGVCVYEGTTAPSGALAEGVGGVAPFGILEAAHDTGTLTTDAASSGGFYRSDASNAVFYLYPDLLDPDDHTDSISVEVWAICHVSGAGTGTLSVGAWPDDGLGGTVTVLTPERDGSFATATVSSSRVLTRIGIFTFPRSAGTPGRWILSATRSGTCDGVDALLIVPARRRVCTATGGTVAAAQKMFGSLSALQLTKVIRSDLSGLLRREGYGQLYPAGGASGQPIEFPPGDVSVLHHVGREPVDTTDGVAYSLLATAQTAVHFSVWPRYHLVRSE